MKLSKYIQQNYDPRFREEMVPFPIVQRHKKKGEIVYPYGSTTGKLFFLNEGIVETQIAFGELEKTLSFIFPGNFFGPFASLQTQSPAGMSGVAITDCVYEEFYYADYIRLCERSLLANKVGRVELSNYYLKKYARERDFLIKTTEEMYREMVLNNPEILESIPLKKVANYFGVLPETLSRIRKKLIS